MPSLDVDEEEEEKQEEGEIVGGEEEEESSGMKEEQEQEQETTRMSRRNIPFQSCLIHSINEKTVLKSSVTKKFAMNIGSRACTQEEGVTDQVTTMTFSIYNTRNFFEQYKAHEIHDILRVLPEKTIQCKFDTVKSEDAAFTTYHCNEKEIRKSDLTSGLLAISFNSPLSKEKYGVVLSKLITSANDMTDTYVTTDENMLLHFEKETLFSISVRHDAIPSELSSGLSKNHFLELRLSDHQKDFYQKQLGKSGFDTLFMKHAQLNGFIKNIKKAGGKTARKLNQKKTKLFKKTLAMKLNSLPRNAAISVVEDARGTTTSQARETVLTISLKNKNFRLEGDLILKARVLQLKTKKGELVSLYEAMDIVEFEIGTRGTAKYMGIIIDNRPELNIDVSKVDPVSENMVYYGMKGDRLYLFVFTPFEGTLSAIYVMNKKSNVAQQVINSVR
jgi:hypothetical protein